MIVTLTRTFLAVFASLSGFFLAVLPLLSLFSFLLAMLLLSLVASFNSIAFCIGEKWEKKHQKDRERDEHEDRQREKKIKKKEKYVGMYVSLIMPNHGDFFFFVYLIFDSHRAEK